ncbi:MAG: hypothetical protein HN849_07825 [Victivallales bacterium]|nr:hypothetical protein [Victivallales bacterium]
MCHDCRKARLLRALLAWSLAMLLPDVSGVDAMDIADRKQLLIDDALLQTYAGLRFTMHPARKRGHVLLPELPSEKGRIGFYGSVADVDGTLMMWYWAQTEYRDDAWRKGLALATSTDGAVWTKPNLGLVARGGSKDNNLVNAFGDTVSINPHGDVSERFVLIHPKYRTDRPKGGVYLSFSPDGIHWRSHAPCVFPFVPDTQNQVRYEERIGKWVSYVRTWHPNRRVGRIEIEDLKAPWPYRQDQAPRLIWGDDCAPVPSTEIEEVLACEPELDGEDADVYTPVAVEYPWADRAHFMFPSIYQHLPPPAKGGRYGNDGVLDIHLAVSRDGRAWQRLSPRSYLPLGMDGEPDSRMLYMFAGLVRRGDRLLHYYCGYKSTHGAHPKGAMDAGAICLAEQRLDGFVSLQAGAEPGTLETKPLVFRGRRLELNLATAATGQCQVELADASGRVLPGFGYDACLRIRGNGVALPVRWQSSPSLAVLAGKPVRLRIRLRNADLYAFQFGARGPRK